MVSLTKISRKLRKKTGYGLVTVLGPGRTAEAVLKRWEIERKDNLDTWAEQYKEKVKSADVDAGIERLTLWYEELDKHSSELREKVSEVYKKIKEGYKEKKKRTAAVEREKIVLPVTVRRR